MQCLQEVRFQSIVNASLFVPPHTVLGVPKNVWPNVDGVVLPGQPDELMAAGEYPDLPVITGSNADEMNGFFLPSRWPPHGGGVRGVRPHDVPVKVDALLEVYRKYAYDSAKKALIAMMTDRLHLPNFNFAEGASGGSEPAHAYHFTHVMEVDPYEELGAFHGLDVLFVFGNFPEDASPGEADLPSHAMQGAWGSFAHTGIPALTPPGSLRGRWTRHSDPDRPRLPGLRDPGRPLLRSGRTRSGAAGSVSLDAMNSDTRRPRGLPESWPLPPRWSWRSGLDARVPGETAPHPRA